MFTGIDFCCCVNVEVNMRCRLLECVNLAGYVCFRSNSNCLEQQQVNNQDTLKVRTAHVMHTGRHREGLPSQSPVVYHINCQSVSKDLPKQPLSCELFPTVSFHTPGITTAGYHARHVLVQLW